MSLERNMRSASIEIRVCSNGKDLFSISSSINLVTRVGEVANHSK
jgi:hypothetical protein